MAAPCRIMCCVTKLRSSQTDFMYMAMSSQYLNGLHTHWIFIQQSTFGMYWSAIRYLHHGCAAEKSAATCVMLSGQNHVESMPQRT